MEKGLKLLLTKYLNQVVQQEHTKTNAQIADCCLYLLSTEMEVTDGNSDPLAG